MPLPLVVSAGEPAGIAPEIIGAAWRHFRHGHHPDTEFVVIGDADLLARRGHIPTRRIATIEQCRDFAHALPVLHRPYAQAVEAGTPNQRNAPMVQAGIAEAALLCHRACARAMITAPIDKNVLQSPDFRFGGHTEYLQWLDRQYGQHQRCAVMLLACDDLRCVPVTVHVSLAEAIRQLSTPRIVDTALVFAQALQQQFGIQTPKLAVAGLNPHAGEHGLMGEEEDTIITPALEQFRTRYPSCCIEGPFPADSLFSTPLRQKYDGFICMYHDQALIPVKTLAFERAVNITIGLTIVRTSPDHGTAYGLAASRDFNPQSMIAAINYAAKLS